MKALAIAILLLGGCATAPQAFEYECERTTDTTLELARCMVDNLPETSTPGPQYKREGLNGLTCRTAVREGDTATAVAYCT